MHSTAVVPFMGLSACLQVMTTTLEEAEALGLQKSELVGLQLAG